MNYVKELDGVRGLAIAAVMMFHFGYLPAGWIGVQAFFVLSGFLITNILVGTKELPARNYFGRFYWRRTLRIFPIYYVFLFASVAIYALFDVPRSLGSDWPWLFSYLSNFARLRATDLPSFGHTWSLAVEEQFYLLWPTVVFVLPIKWLRFAIAAILLASPMVRLAVFHVVEPRFGDNFAGKVIYSLPITQLDAFAAGAAVAVFKISRIGRLLGISFCALCLAGIGVLAVDYIAYRRAFWASFGYQMFMVHYGEYAWGYTLINVTAALSIANCLNDSSFLTPLLNIPGIQSLGKISYGVYLFHLPLLISALAMFDQLGSLSSVGRLGFFVAWSAITIVLAALSFRYLEMPFLRLKDKTSNGNRFLFLEMKS